MRTNTNCPRSACSLVAASLLLLLLAPLPLPATDDFPAEAKGYQSTSYDLSQYESVNLANGNLTFRVPLYTLTTNGGLSYDIALHFNSKLWSHRVVQCMNGRALAEGRVRVADGVPNYGFGWDLRPPRLEMDSECVNLVSPDDPCDEAQLERPLAWVDASGARHYLYDSMPWESELSGTAFEHACEFSPGGGPCYSWDGTNLRVTPEYDLENNLAGAIVEDGAGTRYIHKHIVLPEHTNDKRYRDNAPEQLDHFHEEVSGFYLSAIERGPYGPDGAANRIEFAYCVEDGEQGNPDMCGLGSLSRPWLLREIRAVGSEVRPVTLSYLPFTVQDDPEVRVPVLQTMTTPAFDSGVRDLAFGYVPHEVPVFRWDVGLPNNPCTEEIPGLAPAPFLHLVELGEGISFRFAPCVAASCAAEPNDWVFGSLRSSDLVVQLPAGGQVAYDIGAHTPTGMVNTKTIRDTALESNPALLQVCNPEADEFATAGVRLRHRAYHDAATQAPRVETTWSYVARPEAVV